MREVKVPGLTSCLLVWPTCDRQENLALTWAAGKATSSRLSVTSNLLRCRDLISTPCSSPAGSGGPTRSCSSRERRHPRKEDFWGGSWKTARCIWDLGTRTSQLAASLARCLWSWGIFARWKWSVLLGAQRTLLSTCNFLSELSFLFMAVFLIFPWASNDSDYVKCGTFHVLWKWLSDPTLSASRTIKTPAFQN